MSGIDWRAGLAAAALAASLALQLPPFLAMPRWCDSYFYDTVAASVLRGDPIYREHMLYGAPGMALAQAGVRAALGWSNTALRAFDAVVLLAAAWFVAAAALTPGRRAETLWLMAAAGGLHFGATEWSHCQPDLWMAAPAFAATALRAGRWSGGNGSALLEGVLWGVACAIKPFAAAPAALAALCCWCSGSRTFRQALLEELRVLAGGVAVVASVAAWIVGSGNGPHYLAAVGSSWWRDYFAPDRAPLRGAVRLLAEGRPETILVVLGAAVGAWDVARAFRAGTGERLRRGIVGAACWGWLLEGLFLQAKYHYHLIPALLASMGAAWTLSRERPRGEAAALVALAAGAVAATLLPKGAVAVVGAAAAFGAAAWRWPRAAGGGLLAATMLIALSRHALLDRERLALWPRCWFEANTPALLDALRVRHEPGIHIEHAELLQVADFLRSRNVQDRDVECLALASLPLYVELGLRTPHPYLMPVVVDQLLPKMRGKMLADLRGSPRRYTVVCRACPLILDMFARHGYPDGREVFRTGCYAVLQMRP